MIAQGFGFAVLLGKERMLAVSLCMIDPRMSLLMTSWISAAQTIIDLQLRAFAQVVQILLEHDDAILLALVEQFQNLGALEHAHHSTG